MRGRGKVIFVRKKFLISRAYQWDYMTTLARDIIGSRVNEILTGIRFVSTVTFVSKLFSQLGFSESKSNTMRSILRDLVCTSPYAVRSSKKHVQS